MAFDFNANYYLLQYPDVAAAVVRGQFASAYDHFVLFGARELRNPNAEFNALEYAALNPDVAAAVSSGAFPSLWAHYVSFGLAENRAPNAALAGFDAAGYLALNTDVAAAVASGAFKSAIDHYLTFGQAEGRGWGNETQLTNGTDTLVGNKFVAGQVFNPGGTDRINSLQDEDELTGIGENPTLTATLGNANDNGGTIITPVLNGVETVNVAFTGSGGGNGAVTTLDLQDSTGLTKAVNITRITDGNNNVTIRNLTSVPAELSVANTHSPAAAVNFTFLAAATAGAADATQLTLSNAQIGALKVESNDGTTGIETINLVSKGSANTVGTLTAQDLQTLTISGDQDFTLTSTKNVVTKADSNLVEAVLYTGGLQNVAGSLSKIDGSAATGNLTLNLGGIFAATKDGTSGTDIAVEVLGGKGNDTFILTDTLGANDKINGGEGKNTVVLTAGDIVGTADNVQTLDIRANAASPTIDTSKLAQLETVVVRNESNVPGAIPATDPNVADAQAVVVTLNKLSTTVAENAGITVKHGTTGNNDLASLTVVANLATATGTNDTVVFNIAEGVNADPRFNVTLGAANVENITLNDNDSESNTVALTNHGQHTGTITLKGGVAGQFLNLDYSENALRKDTTGAAADDVGIANTVGSNIGALVASVIDAEDFVGDAIIRVSSAPLAISAVGAQTIKLGSGNDTLIFDNLGDSRAGLSISDTVSGGAGNDTLAIGGDVAVNLGASEWTNVSGFETIRLLGNGATYTLSLTDQLITQNAADGKIINIINDNDPANDAANALDTVGVGTVSAVTIDARALSVGLNFNYNGEEGIGATADRFIFSDAQINSTAVIDGGAADNNPATFGRNADVIEVRNSAVISAGDLQNIKNVGTLDLTNDQAAVQNFTVQLNDTIVDALVDSYHTSTATEAERLAIRAYDNSLVNGANSALRLEAGTLTAKSGMDVLLGRGVNNVVTGAGVDRVVLLGNYVNGTYAVENEFGQSINALATGIGGPRIVTDTIDLGAGDDTLATYGALNVVGATLSNIEHIEAHSGLVITTAQLAALTSLTFVGTISHELFIVQDPSVTNIDLSKIVVETGGTLHYNLEAGLTTSGTATGNVVVNIDLTSSNVGNNSVINLTAGGTFLGKAGVNDTFEGEIATLNGTTITGTATDQEALRLKDAGTIALGNDGAGGTITNVHTLVLANGANTITFAGTPGFRTIVGNDGNDNVNVSGLGASFAAGTVMLNGGDDTLTLGGQTYTGTLNAGTGTNNTLGLENGANIADATITNFQNLTLGATATVTMTLEQHNAFTGTVTASGASQKVVITGDGGSVTLKADIEGYDFSAVTQGMAITGSNTSTIIVGGEGNDSITGGSGNDSISGGDGNDSISGGAGNDTINGGEGADTITVGSGQDTVILTETTAATDTIIWNTAFATGNTNAVTITDFAFGAGANGDEFDFQQNLSNGTTVATSSLSAIAWASLVNANDTATADDVLFNFGASRLLAPGTTISNAVTNAVTALTTGTDFASANVSTGDSLLLLMQDGTNTFLFHYVADATPATTTAADLSLVAIFNGAHTASIATGDFI